MAVPASKARNSTASAIRNVIVASFTVLWVSPTDADRRGEHGDGRRNRRLELAASAGERHGSGDHGKNELTCAEGGPESGLKSQAIEHGERSPIQSSTHDCLPVCLAKRLPGA
jgi:hypothetical protein